MQELLKRETFTAVYATADTLAIGACRALKEAGISVPEECSVAGFDGMDAGRFYIPSLTTIRQPVEEIGKATAGLLFDLIKGKEKPRQLIYEGELIQRESTARCKSKLRRLFRGENYYGKRLQEVLEKDFIRHWIHVQKKNCFMH